MKARGLNETRVDKGRRPRVLCPCGRHDMDYTATCCRLCHNDRRRAYHRAYARTRRVGRTCEICGTSLAERNGNAKRCHACATRRNWFDAAPDFPPHIIEQRLQRAKAERAYQQALQHLGITERAA